MRVRNRGLLWLAALTAAGAALTAAAAAPAGAALPEARPDTLTVEECIAVARTRAAAVRAVASDAAAAHLDSAATAYNRRPSFSIFGGATVAPDGFYDPVVTDLGQYQLKLGVALPLYDGGVRRRERDRAALGALAASLELQRVVRDAGLRAATVALDLLRQREAARLQFESLGWLERLAGLVESGVRGGADARSDAVRVALERDAVVAALGASRQETGALSRELGLLLDWPDAVPEVREPGDAGDGEPSAGDSLAVMAWVEGAPEARQAQAAIAAARVELEQARRRNALEVDVAADAGLAGADLTSRVPAELRATHPNATLGDRLRRDLGASVSLEFRRPVLDPSARPGAAAREATVRAAELRAQGERGERLRLALDLLARWRAAAHRVALTTESAVRAEDHVVRLKSMYAGGAVGLLELLDARRALDEARERLAEARFDSRLARYEAEILR